MTFLNKPFTAKQIIAISILLTLVVFQLLRVVVFVNTYGGLEHDGGWLLGVSRSLAERGTYTTLVSTIVDPRVHGDINVDDKFDIQDDEGRIWFFTGNGIGPGSILINAIFLKLFGFGFWSFHMGPLFFMTLFLLLASAILLDIRGLTAILLFNFYLWLYPHLIIFLGYEGMGEMPTLAYILLAFTVFIYTVQKTSPPTSIKKCLWFLFFLSGLAAGLVINTKLIALLSLGGIFIIWLRLVWEQCIKIKETLALIGGFLVIPILWELVHLVTLTWVTDFQTYIHHLQERVRFILDDGSGIGVQDHKGIDFIWNKVLVVSEISHTAPIFSLLILLLVTLGGAGLIWHTRLNRYRQNWIILLWVGWVGNMAWFIGLAKTGWVRHAWFGLILAVLILCLLFGETLQQIKRRPNWRNLGLMGVLVVTLLPGFVAQRDATTLFITDRLVEVWRQKQLIAKYSKVPWMITPRAEQEKVVELLNQLPPTAHIFYPANHKAAEIAVQTGRIFYPIARREQMQPTPDDVVIIGATLISPWKDPGIRHSLIERAKVECPNFLHQSEYYIICRQW